MSFFLFILGILILLIIMPAIKAAHRINQFRKQMNEMADRARKTYGRAAGAYGHSQPNEAPKRKKKIGADIGEYVEWEEVEVTVENGSYSAYTAYTGEVEEQITDAEWEEVR